MLRTMQWRPDTHPGVVVDLQWDDAEPEAAHVCLAYTADGVASGDPEGDYAKLLGENQAKNQAIATLAAHDTPIEATWALGDGGQIQILVPDEHKETAQALLSGSLPDNVTVA